MNKTIERWSVGNPVGSDVLAGRFAQTVSEHETGCITAASACGSLQVIAAQAIRELEIAEAKSLDPADVLAREDAAL